MLSTDNVIALYTYRNVQVYKYGVYYYSKALLYSIVQCTVVYYEYMYHVIPDLQYKTAVHYSTVYISVLLLYVINIPDLQYSTALQYSTVFISVL